MILVGFGVALFLHGAAGWWSATALAQLGPTAVGDGGGNTTTTTSTTHSTHTLSPPDCEPVGSSAFNTSVTSQTTFGPATILIGEDQSESYFVAAGTTNVNINTHTATFLCVAAVPVMPRSTMAALGLGLTFLGVWRLRRRVVREPRG
jgi:hypothetical protein